MEASSLFFFSTLFAFIRKYENYGAQQIFCRAKQRAVTDRREKCISTNARSAMNKWKKYLEPGQALSEKINRATFKLIIAHLDKCDDVAVRDEKWMVLCDYNVWFSFDFFSPLISISSGSFRSSCSHLQVIFSIMCHPKTIAHTLIM